MSYTKKPVITLEEYYRDMLALCDKIKDDEFQAIVALKRSGFILGAFLSNQKTLPLFVVSEIKSMPITFSNILFVDDKTCTGKSFNKAIHKIPLLVSYKTACLYLEGSYKSNFYIKDLGIIHRMWYEKN